MTSRRRVDRKGTIYRYFPTKEDLYFATILHGIDTLTDIAGRATEPEQHPARRLERIAVEILDFFWDRVHLFRCSRPRTCATSTATRRCCGGAAS
jgi:AcrR family transcriptional regulator